MVELLNAAHKQDGQIRRKKSEIIAQSVDVSLGDNVPITEEPGEKRPELPLEATTTKKYLRNDKLCRNKPKFLIHVVNFFFFFKFSLYNIWY